jgi:CheY-like chemotaxis protein
MPRPAGTRVRVVVVDDDAVNRHGMAALLSASEQISLVAALDHDDALAVGDMWQDTDVAVVDAADHRRTADQFPGVAVVEHIRRHATSRLTVIVVTGHFFDDAVRRRMREARADFFYHRADMADAQALYDAVLRPEEARRRVPEPRDPESQFRHGVSEHTRVNQAVGYALENALEDRLAEHAEPRSRRWLRLRGEFNRVARLTPVTSDGRRPDRPQDEPSLPQITRFIAWAMKVKQPSSENGESQV